MTAFGSATQRVRPIRLAYLVEPNNADQVREAIRISSTVWGGTYCPIIPLHEKMPKVWHQTSSKALKPQSVVEGYLDAFDPDVLIQFTGDVPPYIKDLGREIVAPAAIWETLKDDRTLAAKYAIGVFEILNDIFDKNFKFKAKYPPRLVIPRLPSEHQLFWASVLGEVPATVLPDLRQYYYEPLEISEIDFTVDDFAELRKGNVLFPLRFTHHELKTSRKSWHRGAYAFFFDANEIDDVIDYWNLKALGRRVLPIPKQLQAEASLKAIAEEYFRAQRVPWRHNPKVCDYASIVRSRHSTLEEIQEYAKSLNLERPQDDTSDSPFFSIQHWYPRVWDEWARDKDGAVPDDVYGEEQSIEIDEGQGAKFRLKPQLPTFAVKHAYHNEWRCANDISFNIYGSTEPLAEVFPKAAGKRYLSVVAGRFHFHDDWRISRNGLVRLVRDSVPEVWEVPSSEDVFFGWLEDYGWRAQLSAPGRLAKQMYKQLEGHPQMLKNEKFLGLLEHMNGGTVQADGQPVQDNRVSRERELPVGEIRSRLRGNQRSRDLVDYLIGRGIFRVGLKLQCPRCTRHSWYPVSSIGDVFNCPRCLNAFPAIGNIETGGWAYKTAGPFSVPRYADGAMATLLALQFFNRYRSLSSQTTSAFSFIAKSDTKPELEADFALFWRESAYGEQINELVFGECKTYGLFEDRDYRRMHFVGEAFAGAVLVFATLRKSLTETEIRHIRAVAKKGRAYWKAERPINPVLVLTNVELLSDIGPPYCWRNGDAESKFEHSRSLLDICNATQQLYLGLPPWEEEWQEKWEKRRRRRVAI